MPTYKTTGIVLKRTNLSEADRIITFLTADYGKVRAVAKGVRKIKSRLAGHLELFTESELLLAKGRNLDVVAGARIKQHFPRLASDWDSLTFGYLVTEMIDKLTEDGLRQSSLYRITIELLSDLDQKGHSAMIELAFKLKLLNTLGYRPHLDNCVICGQDADKYYFEPKLGAIVDSRCSQSRAHAMTAETVQLWRDGIDGEPIGDREKLADGSLAICDEFIERTFGRKFNSRSLMETSVG